MIDIVGVGIREEEGGGFETACSGSGPTAVGGAAAAGTGYQLPQPQQCRQRRVAFQSHGQRRPHRKVLIKPARLFYFD